MREGGGCGELGRIEILELGGQPVSLEVVLRPSRDLPVRQTIISRCSGISYGTMAHLVYTVNHDRTYAVRGTFRQQKPIAYAYDLGHCFRLKILVRDGEKNG